MHEVTTVTISSYQDNEFNPMMKLLKLVWPNIIIYGKQCTIYWHGINYEKINNARVNCFKIITQSKKKIRIHITQIS